MSVITDINSPQSTALRRRQMDNVDLISSSEFRNDPLVQNMNQGFLSLFAMLLGFLKVAPGQNFTDNASVKNMFSAFSFSNKDMDFANSVSRNLRSGNIKAHQAAGAIFNRVRDPENTDWSKASTINMKDLVTNNTESLLHPALLLKMETSEEVRQMVQWTFEAADRNGLDKNLLANQFWTESKYDPKAGSGEGALGIAQIVPKFHQGKWGLNSRQDFLDPKKSIDAGAEHMGDLTRKLGSQEIALVAYNGGEGAVNWIDKKTAGNGVGIDQWMEAVHHERATKGVDYQNNTTMNLWRHQTYDYVARTSPKYWDKTTLSKAELQQTAIREKLAEKDDALSNQETERVAKQDGLSGEYNKTIAKGGTPDDATPRQPIILTAEHKKVILEGGTDEIKIAAQKDAEQPKPDEPTVIAALTAQTADIPSA
jgi:soluble lytic murein transglycosylase-like protein